MVASKLMKALCLTGVVVPSMAFVSPCALQRASARALGGGAAPEERCRGTVTRWRGERLGVRMITNLTGQDKKKGDDFSSVKASVKDRREGKKTEPDKLDDKSFPILDDLGDEEDTNIKVTPNAWKWPPLWPYTPDYFDRPDETEDELAFASARMTPCLEGEARESLISHYARFLTDGARVLELGSSVDSYLPEDISFSKVVGIGMNAEEMDGNPRLTERVVQNLNTKPELPYASDSFDVVLIPNSVEFFTNPRLLMREVYRVLRPEGLCMVPFTGQGAYKEYEKKQIKMWKTMNDAQHMWIVGSFFKFSADAGWDNLKGYDLSSGGGVNVLTKFVGGSSNLIFVVQAEKAIPPDPSDVGNTIRNRLYGTKSLDTDDVDFVALRLHARYRKAQTDEERAATLALIDPLVEIYDLLGEMPPGVLFAPYKAILAEALSPNWNGSDEQKAVLREGLGLTPAREEVWAPLGKATERLHPEDRVRLLVDLVPLFQGTEEEKQALLEMKEVLPQVSDVLSEKMRWSTPDIQMMATDIIVTDFLTDKKEGRDSFVEWLRSVDPLQLEVWRDERKNFKVRAKEEMERGGLRSASI